MKTYDAPVASTTNTGTPVHCASNESKREDVLASIGRQGLVVVAGTGISISAVGDITPEAAVAGWPGLLMHGVNHCRRHQLLTDAEAEIVERQIKNGVDTRATASFVDAAQKIHDSLKGRVNGRQWWLAESIGKLKVKEARLIRAIQGLGGLIATLNYDS